MSNIADGQTAPLSARPSNVYAAHVLGKAKHKNKKMIQCALYAAAYVFMSIVYVSYTSPTWSYMGLDLAVNPTKIVSSVILLMIFILFTPVMWSARAFFLNIIITAYVLPATILYGFSDRPTSAIVVISIAVAIVFIVSAFPISRIRILTIDQNIMVRFLLLISVGLVFLFILFGGFSNFNLDYSKVYEFRDVASDSLPGIFDYLSSIFTKAIIPLGIVISFYYKKYASLAAFFVISVILFGLTGHKGMAVIAFLTVGVFLLLARRPGYTTILISFTAITLLIAIAAVADSGMRPFSFWGQVETLFLRRALFVPSLVDYNYLEYFSEGHKYYWSTSRFTLGLLNIPYDGVSPPLLIGRTYFGEDTSANAGFIGSGFAQAGILGVILYSIGAGLVIATFQAYSRTMGVPFVAAATIGLFTSMIQSTDFITLFLTNGLLPALIILALMRDPDSQPRKAKSTLSLAPAR